jgi:putative oxidoreductase
MSKKQVTLECICALLILLFLYASISKFLDFKTFIDQMNNQPLPNSWTPFLVWSIPLLEIAISITLLFEYTRLLGLYASLVLMVIFTLYTGIVLLHFFHYIPCSCGGVIRNLTWSQHLTLNLFYIAILVLGIILQHQQRKSFKPNYINNKHSLV